MTSFKMNRLVAVLGGCLMVAVLALPAHGAEISFDQAVDAGTIAWDGTGALVGADIAFDSVFAVGTANPGVYVCDGCILSFTTGATVTEIAGTPTIIIWNGAGTFTLTGEIVGVTPGSVTLLTGTFSGAVGTIDPTAADLTIGVTGVGIDTKHESIVSFFAVGPNFNFTSSNISGELSNPDIDSVLESGFDAVVVEADLSNRPGVSNVVPEPGTLLLLGSGLAGLGLLGRRRTKA